MSLSLEALDVDIDPHGRSDRHRRIDLAGRDASAEVKIDTFTFTRCGLLHGAVLSMSQDAITRDRPQDKSSTTGRVGRGRTRRRRTEHRNETGVNYGRIAPSLQSGQCSASQTTVGRTMLWTRKL